MRHQRPVIVIGHHHADRALLGPELGGVVFEHKDPIRLGQRGLDLGGEIGRRPVVANTPSGCPQPTHIVINDGADLGPAELEQPIAPCFLGPLHSTILDTR